MTLAAAANDPSQDEAPYAWVVVWATFVSLAVIFGVAYSFAAYFESLAAQFHATRADVSLVFGLCGLLYFALGIGGGMLSDRFGPRAVACAGMLCIAAGLAASSWAQSMAAVIVCYGVGVGTGIALVYTPSIGCVQPWFKRRRGLAAGIASAGIGAGTLVVPLIASSAIGALQWRGAMRAMALGVLVLGLASAALMRRAPSATARGTQAVAGATLGEAMRSRSFAWLYLMTVLAAPAMFIPFAHVSAAARDMGLSDARAVGLVGLIGIGSLTGRFAIGALADRVGRPLTLVLAQVSMGLAFLLWWAASGYATLAAFALWMGLSYGGIVSLMPALCMDLFGARAVASIIGLLYSGAALGNLAGPWVAGWVFDRTGSYTPVIWGCLVLQVLATAATSRVTRQMAPLH
jgi:MFS family permease